MIRTSLFISGNPISDHDFTGISVSQKIGGHHTFEVRLKHDAQKGIMLEKTKSWLGETVAIGFDHHDDMDIGMMPVEIMFKGIATSVELSRKNSTGEIVLKGHSPTIVMDDGPNTQSFMDADLQEIVDSVMEPYNGAFPESPIIAPTKSTTIDYTVQYKESNFKFINRLANRFGEWFYYDGLDLHFGKLGKGDLLNLNFGENGLTFFDLTVEALPTQIEMKAYDYRTNKVIIDKSPESVKSNEVANEVFNTGSKKVFSQTPVVNVQTDVDEDELKEIVKRREQIAADEMVIMSGVSSNCKICPGVKINVSDDTLNENYGEYIVIRASHQIGQGGAYSNSFEAVPAEMKQPPLSSMPDPPFCETQLATVVETNDEKSLGRVKVEFFWQQSDGETSPWIRVASPYTGNDKGFFIIPEIGDQVLVAFENNNPDKPYVLSGMYHGEANPEWYHNDNRYKGFKSKGKNQWKFDDKNQSINITAPNSMMLHAGNKITMKTDGKEDSEISIDVGDGTINVIAKHIYVMAAETVDIQSYKNLNTYSKEATTILSDDKITIDALKELKENAGTKMDMSSAEIKVAATVKSEVSGANVELNGSAIVKATSPLIKLN